MVNFNFSDYIAIIALVFLIFSLVRFKEPSLSKFFITMFVVFTIYTTIVVMVQFSLITGLLMVFCILFPISSFRIRNKK
jgi:hypothetical protein